MKRKTITRKTRIWIAAATLTLIGVIIAACFITHAAFTNSLRAQRAIAAYESSRDRFTSNYLKKFEEASGVVPTKTIYVTSTESTPTAIISVCNYPQGNRAQFLEDDVSYTLKAEYMIFDSSSYVSCGLASVASSENGITGGFDVEISPKNSDTPLISLSSSTTASDTSSLQTVTGGAADSNLYVLRLGKCFSIEAGTFGVKVTATPTNDSYNTLECLFLVELRPAGAQTGWTGDFTDRTTTLPKEYDGFNYKISGTGSGTATLTWDTSYLDLSAVQKIEIGAQITVTGNIATAVFPVDSTVLDNYDFQFYKTTSFESVSWEDLKGVPASGGNPGIQGIVSFSFS